MRRSFRFAVKNSYKKLLIPKGINSFVELGNPAVTVRHLPTFFLAASAVDFSSFHHLFMGFPVLPGRHRRLGSEKTGEVTWIAETRLFSNFPYGKICRNQ